MGLFEGFEERGVLGNDMILERGRQQQHQQKQLNKTTTTTTNNQLGAKWMERATRQECVGGAVEEQETHRERDSLCVFWSLMLMQQAGFLSPDGEERVASIKTERLKKKKVNSKFTDVIKD